MTIETLKTQIENVESQIDNVNSEIEAKQSEINNFEYECSESEYDDWLDLIFAEVNIGSLTFSPSEVMKALDPIAYRCGKSDYESDYDLDDCEEYTDLKDELEELESQLSDLESELEELETELKELLNQDFQDKADNLDL